MALGACHGRSHPRSEGRIHPIDDRDVSVLLVVRAAFIVRLGVSVKGGGDQLFLRGILVKISRQLFDREPVERFVTVERTDHVIAVRPDGPGRIIGIAG